GAHAHNLKKVDARFPVGRLSVITGISGSGKSTLMRSVLLPAVKESLGSARDSRAGRGDSPRSHFSFALGKTDRRDADHSTRAACAPQTGVSGAEFFETASEVDQ